jgi:hypothetical protein
MTDLHHQRIHLVVDWILVLILSFGVIFSLGFSNYLVGTICIVAGLVGLMLNEKLNPFGGKC